jgi:hypothetical protein
VRPELEVSPGQPRPIVQADADQLGLVGLLHPCVPPALDIDAGTVVRGLVWDTRSGRSPLSRLAAGFAAQDPALRLGTASPGQACNDDTVGRVRERL